MGRIPNELKTISNNLKNREKIYHKYLSITNGTENLTFEEEDKQRINREIQNILEDSRLSEKNAKIMEDYYLYLVNAAYSVHSRKTYLQYVRNIAVGINKELGKITKRDLQEYFLSLENRGLREASLSSAKMHVICFYKWFLDVPKDATNREIPELIRWIDPKDRRTIRSPDEVLTPDEVRKMAQIADNPRDTALHLTLFETGARCSEFLRIRVSDVVFDKHGAVIKVLIGKKMGYRKSRKLRLIYCVPALKQWIESSPVRDEPEAPLWVTLGSYLGRPLGTSGLKGIIKSGALRANVPRKKSFPHSYRHSRVYDLLSKGFTEKDLRLWFGWSAFSNMPALYSGAYGMKDMERKILKQEGLLTEEEEEEEVVLRPRVCTRCGHTNSSTLKFCEKCYFALDLKAIMEDEKEKENIDNKTAKLVKFLLKKVTELDPKAKEELELFRKVNA